MELDLYVVRGTAAELVITARSRVQLLASSSGMAVRVSCVDETAIAPCATVEQLPEPRGAGAIAAALMLLALLARWRAR